MIGWQHAEPVLRSLAYGLLDRSGDGNPASRHLEADRPCGTIGAGEKMPSRMAEPARRDRRQRELLRTLREASPAEARESRRVAQSRCAPQSIWDGLFSAAANS